MRILKKKLQRLALLLYQDLLENKVIDLHVTSSLNFLFYTRVQPVNNAEFQVVSKWIQPFSPKLSSIQAAKQLLSRVLCSIGQVLLTCNFLAGYSLLYHRVTQSRSKCGHQNKHLPPEKYLFTIYRKRGIFICFLQGFGFIFSMQDPGLLTPHPQWVRACIC